MTSPRTQSKRFIFALIYGTRDYRLGSIVYPETDDEFSIKFLGEQLRRSMVEGIYGFDPQPSPHSGQSNKRI